jgi:hypothetical protein
MEMTINRLSGSVLVFVSIVGFLTVGDDMRHISETGGIFGMLVAGMILLVSEFQLWPISSAAARSSAIGILFGIILGAAVGDMRTGVGIGLAGGTVIGMNLRRIRRITDGNIT